MKKKKVRFDYENASLEDILAYKQKLFESNRKFFGKTYRERYITEINRFNLPNTMGKTFADPALMRTETIKQIELMTGKFAFNRGRQARENLIRMIDKLSPAGMEYKRLKKFASTISLVDLERHSEEYDFMFRILEGYGEASKEFENEDIISDVIDTFAEIQERKLRAKGVTWNEDDWANFTERMWATAPTPEDE